jgi:gamma-glutamyltranspeptidase/glutathione hydrolase
MNDDRAARPPEQRFDWTMPYASRRQPIFAPNAVATSQPLATQACIAMLARGGNAVDAALATAITLALVEPCSNGIGSDSFAILWDGRQLVGLNASGRAPAAWTPARFAGRDAMPQRGWDSVTIPGAVSGWVALSQRYGKLPFADLFEPAIRYARDGFPVSPVVTGKWRAAVPLMPTGLGWHEHFLPSGHAPNVGERFTSPAVAATLEKVAASKGDAFYHGDLAATMAAHSQAHGGAHTVADFAAHACDWVEPLAQDYRGVTVHEIPPNGQGIAALIALGILDHFDVGSEPPDSVASQHLQIEAMKLGFADAYRYVADIRSMEFPPSALLDRAYLASRARLIDRSRAQDFGAGARSRRNGLSLCRRRQRDDGVADPIELHGLRRRRRCPRHGHFAAKSRRRIRAASRASERSRRRQAPVSYDHSWICHA